MSAALELVFVNETSHQIDKIKLTEYVQRVFCRVQDQANQTTGLQHPEPIGRLVTEIVFVGDKKIQALNAQFRGQNTPTDVLSFERPEAGSDYPASVVVSIETAARQASAAGWTVDQEVRSLASHGLLHVLGFAHA